MRIVNMEKLRYGISRWRILGYSIIWGIVLFVSTFPQVFDSIDGNSYCEKSLNTADLMGEKIIILCLFPMMALMVVHTFDVLYSLNMSSTVDEKYKFGATWTITLIILVIVTLGISIFYIDNFTYRILFFIVSWTFIIGLKLVSFKMIKDEDNTSTKIKLIK